jgi:hypothetical protein
VLVLVLCLELSVSIDEVDESSKRSVYCLGVLSPWGGAHGPTNSSFLAKPGSGAGERGSGKKLEI